MTTIKAGYGSKPTEIRVNARDDGKAELWIEQEGTQHWLLGASLEPTISGEKYEDFTVVQDEKGNRFVKGENLRHVIGQETLAYITIEEAIALRDELNEAIRTMAGL